MTKNILLFKAALFIFALGCVAGHFHGKAKVYEGFYNGADHMMINPVALEKIR